MQKKCSKSRKLLSFILCSVLIVAMALFTGCNGSSAGNEGRADDSRKSEGSTGTVSDESGTSDDGTGSDESGTPEDETDAESSSQTEGSTGTDDGTGSDESGTPGEPGSGAQSDGGILGEGSTKFAFAVEDAEGGKTQWEIHTDQKTVGEALMELGLIDGEDSEFGLYVKTVNNITLDYDKDGLYWAFYINDEYAQSGVDSTEIKEGDTYLLKAEKS